MGHTATAAHDTPAILAFMGTAGDAAAQQALIQAATVYPMVVSMTVTNQRGNQRHIVRMYEMRQLADLTDFEDSLVGADEDILRCETFGPDAFRKMPIEKRGFYRAEYQAYLKWRAGDKFDPIRADEDLCNWVRPGRHVGD